MDWKTPHKSPLDTQKNNNFRSNVMSKTKIFYLFVPWLVYIVVFCVDLTP